MSIYADDEYVIRGARSFGAAIKEFRHHRGLSQAELAAAAGVHRSYLSSVENGSTTEAMRNIVRALNVLGLELVVRSRPEAPRTDGG